MQRHVVIDVRATLPKADGLTRYLKEHVPRLVAARAFRTTLLVSSAMRPYWESSAPGAALISSDCRPMWARQNWEIPRILSEIAPDLFFYPAHDPPLLLRTPFVFTVHDLTHHQVRPAFEQYDRLKNAYLRLVTGRGLSRAKAVFAVSEATKVAIGELFGERAEQKTIVTLNGASLISEVGDSGRETRFLYVGTDRPHKNLLRLVEAYVMAVARTPGLPPLEIVGGLRSERQLRQTIERLGVQSRVLLRGHVSEEELETCYTAALALVMPSLSEGFGIPIVEAMQRGVPVVTSNISACAEVAGDAGLLVDPWAVDDMADALARVYSDRALRQDLVRRGLQRVKMFDWIHSTEITLATIERALAER